jgi:hypothetical protein
LIFHDVYYVKFWSSRYHFGTPAHHPRDIKGYDVPDKMARAKLEGWFDEAINRPSPPLHWWKRFRWY